MDEQQNDKIRSTTLKTGVRKSAWMFGAVVTILGGLLFVGSSLPTTPTTADARGWHGPWQRGHHGDPGEHAEFAVEWVLRWVDGTPEQIDLITEIAKASISDLSDLREQHAQRHQTFVAEMSKTTIDRDAIEKLRSEGMEVADQASVRLLDALVQAASVLDVEQRLELLELAERFHGPRRGPHENAG